MVAAGLFGTSGPVLIGQALFVYFRGAIVFYAVRALRPSWDRFRWVLWAVGTVLGAGRAGRARADGGVPARASAPGR